MIIQRRSRGLTLVHLLGQVVLVELTFAAWVASAPVDLIFQPSARGLSNYGAYAAMIGLGLVLYGAKPLNQNAPLLQLSIGENTRRTAQQCTAVLLTLLLFLVLSKDTSISRTFLGSFMMGMYAVLFITNRFLPPLIARTAFSGHQQRTVILGAPEHAQILCSWLDARSGFGLKVVGLVETHEPAALMRRLREYRAHQLIVLGVPKSVARVRAYCQICERLGLRLLILSDSDQGLGRSLVIDEQDGLQFISFQRDVLECPYNRLLKRIFDICIALPICLLVLPFLSVLVWVAQRTQAPGPLFFRQKRTGVHGKAFRIIKFRTMVVSSGDEARQATLDDSRIYPLGAWLRRTSLDEIPQFLNVLFGEMSVVGPRPHLRVHDERFAETATAYRRRHCIKPGITGLAQVKGWRGETKTAADVVRRVEADIQYLESWSLGLDFTIVIRTAVQVFSPLKTAY